MKIGFNAGIYDLFHEGHINIFKRINEQNDLALAVIHDDQSCYDIKGKCPIQSLEMRVINLLRSGLVDGIVITRSKDPAVEFEHIINRYSGNEITYYRGDDWTGDFLGRWMLDKNNIPIVFLPYTKGISSTDIRKSL